MFCYTYGYVFGQIKRYLLVTFKQIFCYIPIYIKEMPRYKNVLLYIWICIRTIRMIFLGIFMSYF